MESPNGENCAFLTNGEINSSKTKNDPDSSKLSGMLAIDRTLLTYKTFYLLFFAGFGSTFPYLTIYFKQLGLNATYVGVLSGIRPLIQFLSGPMWAYIADKYHSRKFVLCMSVVAWLIMTLALVFPQPQNTTCVKINRTTLTKRDLPTHVYQSLPLAQMPVLTRYMFSEKKSVVSTSVPNRPESRDVIVYDNAEQRHLFYIFLILIVVGEIFEAPSFIMIDTALIQQLQGKCHDYGKTRMFGSIGYGLASFGVGAVLDTTTYMYCGHVMTNYMAVFYFFVAFMIIALAFVTIAFTFKYNDETDGGTSSILSVYKLCFTLKYSSFLLTVWFVGIGNGGQMTFINWYLEELGAPKAVMGLATTIRSLAVVSGFFFSGCVINKLGELFTIFCSLLVLSVIFFGYSTFVNQWMIVPMEILQGGVYAISWSTCVVYLSSVAPDDGAATMQSILQGVYWGLGTGIGAIVGGALINHYGLIYTYRLGGIAMLGVTVQFIVTQWLIKKYEDMYQNNEK